jgi:hypothetical protein
MEHGDRDCRPQRRLPGLPSWQKRRRNTHAATLVAKKEVELLVRDSCRGTRGNPKGASYSRAQPAKQSRCSGASSPARLGGGTFSGTGRAFGEPPHRRCFAASLIIPLSLRCPALCLPHSLCSRRVFLLAPVLLWDLCCWADRRATSTTRTLSRTLIFWSAFNGFTDRGRSIVRGG